MKIGDLINVPDIQRVIQLVDADSEDSRTTDGLLATFVITDEIESHLSGFFQSLENAHGTGCFLKGHYGSGKTHFLSFLSLLLKDSRNRERYLPEALHIPRLAGKKYLVISIPLFLFPGAQSLEEIVLHTCEEALRRKLGRMEILAEKTKLLEHFNNYVLPQAPEFLAAHHLDESSWELLESNDPREAAAMALSYLDSLKSNPLRLHYDRRSAFETLSGLMREEHIDGLVLIIDELSEFLKSKPGERDFNEDVRFLQFMGEWAAHEPLWIIASLQEGIEEVGYIEQNLYKRIKDRYPLRFNLTNRHLESLLEKRVLIKKPGSRPIISALHKKLMAAFPYLDATEEYFYKIYPVHPRTLGMLENLMGLFSQHRGVVDFLHTRVKGDSSRNIPGLMEETHEHLLTCDAIFDHFTDKIRETAEIAPYYHVAFRYLAGDIPVIFEKERDRALALKLVKIMILTELSPLEKRKSAKLLADLVLERLSSLDHSVNYDYVRENILDRLVEESSYVKKEPHPSLPPIETIYHVDLATNINQVTNARTKEWLRKCEKSARLWMSILSEVNINQLPFPEFISGEPAHYTMKWDNTPREGWIRLGDITTLDLKALQSLEKSLSTSEKEFVLLIGIPLETEKQLEYLKTILFHFRESPHAPVILGWIPKELDGRDQEAILTTYAHMQLREEASRKPEEREIEQHLDTLLQKEKAWLRETVSSSYFAGAFYDLTGKIPFAFLEYGFLPLPMLLARLFAPALQKKYPLHQEIKPHGDAFHQHQLEKASAMLFERGKIAVRDAEDAGVSEAIESSFIPLGIAKRSSGSFHLAADPSKNKFLAEYMRYVIPGKSTSLQDIYIKMRKGPYGVIRPLFYLATAALMQAGYLTPYNEGHLVSAPSLKKLYSFSIDSLSEGKILEKELQASLPLASFLWGDEVEIAPFTMSVQRLLWDRALKGLERFFHSVNECEKLLERYRGYQVFSCLSYDEISETLAIMREFADSVPRGLESRKGLEKILCYLREHGDFQERYRQYQKYVQFFSTQIEYFQRMRGILANPGLHIPSTAPFEKLWKKKNTLMESLQNLKDLLLNDAWEKHYADFNEFLQEYREEYLAGHDRFYHHEYFARWSALRSSPEYGILAKFSRLFSLQVEHDMIRIHRILESLPQECRRPVREELALSAHCSCGFKLSDVPEGMPPDRIEKLMKKGIDEYLEALQAPEVLEKINLYMDGLRQVGRTELIGHIRKVLVAKGKTVAELSSYLYDEVLSSLNKALAGSLLVVERDIDSLYDEIAGRKFSRVKLKEVVDRWMKGDEVKDVSEDTFIHIISRKNRNEHMLWDGYHPAKEVIREEGERFLEAFWVSWILGKYTDVSHPAWLSSRYRVDMNGIARIVQVGDEALSLHNRHDDLALVEKKLTESGEAESLLKEILPEEQSRDFLITLLQDENSFRFLQQRAVSLMVKGMHDERSGAGGLLAHLETVGVNNIRSPLAVVKEYLTIIACLEESGHEGNLINRYVQYISPMSYLLEKIKSEQVRSELFPGGILKNLEKKVAERIREYTREFGARIKDAGEPSVKDFIPGIFIPRREKGTPAFILIFDGMRWDLWQHLSSSFFSAFPCHRAEINTLIALQPTDTSTNRPHLICAPMEECEGEIAGEKFSLIVSGETPGKQSLVEHFILEDTTPVKVIHFNLIDEALHKSKAPLFTLYGEITREMEDMVFPLLRKIPGDAPVFILSDHGFTSEPRKKSPYFHGGSTPFEMIIPCVTLTPGEDTSRKSSLPGPVAGRHHGS